jgi:ABC-type sugar transport system ATPase subunit
VAGNDVTEWPPGKRDLSFVFQDLALLPHLDVAGNIGFGELARGTERAEVKAKVEAAAASFGLTPLLRRKPHALSGGERQKVALARAVVRRPQAFLMDEPLSHLDPLVRVGARTDLLHLRDRLGVPIVYVTHDPHEALGFGDRVAILHGGRLVQVGTPDEVYSQPRDTFVATFIGPLPMNLIPGEGVVIGVRPEHIGFAPAAEGTITGTVSRILHAGADAIVHVTSEHVVPVVVRTAWEARPASGVDVGLTWSHEDEHRFDPESGLRR